MKPATRNELRAAMPEDWKPDPETILGQLEAMISSGVNIGVITRATDVMEDQIHALLDAGNRARLGRPGDASLPGRDVYDERLRLFAIHRWQAEFDRHHQEKSRAYTEIPSSLYINGIAREAMEHKRLFHLIGGWGVCKTLTLKRFAMLHPMTHSNPGAAFLTLTEETRNVAKIYQLMADAIRLNEKFSTQGRSIGQRVCNALRPGDLLIVDEANYAFKHGTWSVLRDISDNSEASVLLVSNKESNGLVKDNQETLGAFLSRARSRFLDKNDPKDGEVYLAAIGYTGPQWAKAGGDIVVRFGMRGLVKAVEDAEQRAAMMQKKPDVKMLRDAAATNALCFR